MESTKTWSEVVLLQPVCVLRVNRFTKVIPVLFQRIFTWSCPLLPETTPPFADHWYTTLLCGLVLYNEPHWSLQPTWFPKIDATGNGFTNTWVCAEAEHPFTSVSVT